MILSRFIAGLAALGIGLGVSAFMLWVFDITPATLTCSPEMFPLIS